MPDQPDVPSQPDKPSSIQDIESMMQRLAANASPEAIQEALGDVNMLDLLSQMREQAAELLAEAGVGEDDDIHESDGERGDGGDAALGFHRPTTPDGAWEDYPGAEALWEAAAALPPSERLEISIEITATPVTDVEKAFYQTVHYRLLFDIHGAHVTYQDVNSPRQDYLHGRQFPAMVTRPREMWPDAAPRWDTLQVYRYDLSQAMTTNAFPRHRMEALEPAASQLLRPHLG